MIDLIASLFLLSSDIQKQLVEERIISSIPMEEFLEQKGHKAHFTSSVYLVELDSGIRAVLKWDDPTWPRNAVAEVAAFRVSKYLNLHLVPPTVFYIEGDSVGSLQYYVEPAYDLAAKGKYEEALQRTPADELAAIQLFYFVFGQWDSGPSNLIPVEREGICHFALIDNAAIGFAQKTLYGDYSFIQTFPGIAWPMEADEGPFPYWSVRTLPPDPLIWPEKFGDLLTDVQINTLCRLNQPVHFVIWQGSFWRQYRFGSPAYTELYPKPLMTALSNLTEEQLRDFFSNPFGVTFSKNFYQDILERRDQIVSN